MTKRDSNSISRLVKIIFKKPIILKNLYRKIVSYMDDTDNNEYFLKYVEEYKALSISLEENEKTESDTLKNKKLELANTLRNILKIDTPVKAKDRYNVKIEKTDNITEEEYQEAIRIKDENTKNLIMINRKISEYLKLNFPEKPSEQINLNFNYSSLSKEEREAVKKIREENNLYAGKNRISYQSVKYMTKIVLYIIKEIINNDFDIFDKSKSYYYIIKNLPTVEMILSNFLNGKSLEVSKENISGYPFPGPRNPISNFIISKYKVKKPNVMLLTYITGEIIFQCIYSFSINNINRTLKPQFIKEFFEKIVERMHFAGEGEIGEFLEILKIDKLQKNINNKDIPQ